MVELLVISILCILAIVIAILIRYAICHDLKKSVQDVMRFVKKLFKEIWEELFGSSDNNICYPVRFGADEFGIIRANYVNHYFESIYSLFDEKGTFCTRIDEITNPNIIVYYIKIQIQKNKNNINLEDLKDLLQNRLEKMVEESFNKHGIYVPSFQYLDFEFDQENSPQLLYIRFAKNPDGIVDLHNQKEQRLIVRRNSKNIQQNDFVANWEDDECNENRH